MKRIWESERIILTGFRVQDPVPEPPALVRKSVKPEVPGLMLEEFTPLLRPLPCAGRDATHCYALTPVRGGGLRSLPPYKPHRYSRAVMSVRTAEAGYQLFVAVSRPLKSPNVPILP